MKHVLFSQYVQETSRKLSMLDDFLDKNENKVDDIPAEVDEGSIEEIEQNLKSIELLLKQMEYYENNVDSIKNDDQVSSIKDTKLI